MNKDQIKGKAKDIAGRVERQAGEWTDNEKAQGEGMARQAEGKVQKAWGDVKDAGEKAAQDIRNRRSSDTEAQRDLDRKKKDEAA